MWNDLRGFLWLLKLGAVVNLYFLAKTYAPPLVFADAHVLIPAQLLFAVSAFRCLFPVRYENNVVFHDSPLSSIFLTRTLATCSEVALIYQLAYLIRLLNSDRIGWVDTLSWCMVAQVVVSQGFVWGAILSGRLRLYFYEELGWWLIYMANTIASIYLYATVDDFAGRDLLILLNLLFGAVYLPWQLLHLRALIKEAQLNEARKTSPPHVSLEAIKSGLHDSIYARNPTCDPQAWGGLIGATWMTAYWATLIPAWAYLIALKA
ncbi:MAG: hypothetical protein HOC23_19540 [Halieaceae bacterium]|jgi:hypothetical protein|nr:hypothetical protein [Halieaceae bacterium]